MPAPDSSKPGFQACYLRVGDRVYLTNETIGYGVERMMAQAHLLDLTVWKLLRMSRADDRLLPVPR